ncbi:MAG: hypothetical protein ABL929_08390 [Ferruginibacter sp.]|nr:hypothetical protein [Ferruginibacter sp.]
MLIIVLLTEYYFKGGDTNLFFAGTTNVYDNLTHNFSVGLEQVFVNSNDFSQNTVSQSHPSFFFMNPPSINVVRLTGIISLISFNTYTCISLIIGIYTFGGIWNIFLCTHRYFPDNSKRNFIVCFCIPTVMIWASGILKDPYSIGGFGYCLNYLDKFTTQKKGKLKYAILIFINGGIVLMTKDYTLYALAVSFIIAFFYNAALKLQFIVRKLFFYLVIPVGIIASLISFQSNLQDYVIKQVLETAIEKKSAWDAGEGGSNYDIGTIDPSLAGFLSAFPKAVNVSLFRPYLWEASSAIVLFEAILSLFCLLSLFYLVFKFGLFKTINTFFSNQFLITLFIFTIIFSFFVGLNTGNFGSLSRYKAPCLITYLLLIVNTIYVLRAKKLLNTL